MHARVITVASALLISASLSPSAGAVRGARVYIASSYCTGHAYKPSRVTLACGDGNVYATGIAYSTYGGMVARATATIHANDCMPNCAKGHFHSYRGSLSFRDFVRCKDGRLYYVQARYRAAAPFASGAANISPFTCSRAHA
jgi:hypothetical protein